MKYCMVGETEHEVRVNKRWLGGYRVRVFIKINGKMVLNQERIAENKYEIQNVAAHMLRMEDKCGNISNYAGKSRDRNFCGHRRDKLNKDLKYVQ